MRLAAVVVLALAAAPPSGRLLSFEDLYDPDRKLDLSDPPSPTWISDTHYLWPKPEDGDTALLLKVEAASGKAEPLFETARLEADLLGEGIEPKQARLAARRRSYGMDAAKTALLVEAEGDLFHYDLGSRRLRRLTRTPGEEEQSELSPDGTRAAFVRGNDLYAVEVSSGQERRLTTDGSPDVLNGKLDWVYQEEVYGRGKFRGFWWSPDSRRLAFLRLDETKVPRYTLVDEIPYRATVKSYHYPKAGDPNPEVGLGVVDAASARVVWLDLLAPAAAEPLVVDVSWTKDGRAVAFQVQDREQTWLDLNLGDPSSGRSRRLLRETTQAWVEPHGSPMWLADGSFLWLSEGTGWKHLYHHGPDGALRRAVTSGPWEVRELHGADAAGWVYFSGTERSPRGLDVYRVRLDGSGLIRLSTAPGTHKAAFNPTLALWTDTWSTVSQPPQVRLHRADGSEVRKIDPGRASVLEGFSLVRPEFLQVTTRDGFVMEALLFKPIGFDPARRYPVYQFTYAGPHAPRALDKWEPEHLFHQLLLQRGIAVWICDNRTASGKGVVSTWPIYRRAGEQELLDIEDGIAWLKSQPWVDPSRIGLSGRSYGGFMTSYALTHGTSFAMGIAASPVTDWRDYDSIYTERYMLTPAHNPDGYRRTAPVQAAANLHGRLLLSHGLMDDNVHPQNTAQFAYALQQAGKPFRLMTYAKSEHTISEPRLVKHWRALMLSFVEETLGHARQ